MSLPLHISLSRPLVLKTEQKDAFLNDIRESVEASNISAFAVQAKGTRWHPNETGSRHFLVLQLDRPTQNELSTLLDRCNRIAAAYRQPLLYASSATEQERNVEEVPRADQFHISLAWALEDVQDETRLPANLAEKVTNLQITFTEVKMRIGQDVTSINLAQQRSGTRSLFS